MEIDDTFAKEHIHKWTKAWNDHNIKEVLSLYSENISFSSPKIKSVYPNKTSIITNKKDLEEYFCAGLKKFPMLHFTPIDYFLKNKKVILEYNATPDNKIQWYVIEKFEFNNDGLIERSGVYYAGQNETEEGNIKIVRQVFEAFNTGDVSRVQEFISEQYFNHESQIDPLRSKLRGPEEFIDTVRNLRNAFDNLHYEEQETIAAGDKVVSKVNVTGKHTGNFFIIQPSGNIISYRAVHIHRIGDGKVVEHKAIRDDLSLMVQLGVVGPKSDQYESLFQAWKAWKGL
jgi:predicted ester cyclase